MSRAVSSLKSFSAPKAPGADNAYKGPYAHM